MYLISFSFGHIFIWDLMHNLFCLCYGKHFGNLAFCVPRHWWRELPVVAWAPPWRSQHFRVNPGFQRVWCATPVPRQLTKPRSPSVMERWLMKRSPRRAACAAQWRVAGRSCRTRWVGGRAGQGWLVDVAGSVGGRAGLARRCGRHRTCVWPGNQCFPFFNFSDFHGVNPSTAWCQF